MRSGKLHRAVTEASDRQVVRQGEATSGELRGTHDDPFRNWRPAAPWTALAGLQTSAISLVASYSLPTHSCGVGLPLPSRRESRHFRIASDTILGSARDSNTRPGGGTF